MKRTKDRNTKRTAPEMPDTRTARASSTLFPRHAGIRIGDGLVADAPVRPRGLLTPDEAWRLYAPPRTLGATEADQLAMDSHLKSCGFHSLLAHAVNLGMGPEEIAPQFLGYPYLAGLSQNGLIRAGVTTVADEMTRRWVDVRSTGDIHADPGENDRSASAQNDRVRAVASALEDFGIQDIFNEAAQKCDFDGGCLVFIDTGADDMTLQTPLYRDGSVLKNRLRRFTLVEAINLYPGLYNTVDPLSPDYFRPDSWLVLGKKIHRSRFLYFAPNSVNMLLRPAYNFFGIPAAQLALDYVAHFTKCREAAQRLLTKFSLTVFKSNMAGVLSGGPADDMNRRLQYLAQKRDNDSVLLIDKEQEDVVKLETPITGATDVTRQSLEFVAAIFRLPVVKLLGISPAGMNATGEFDERNFNGHVSGKQQKVLQKPLNAVAELLQLHLFGDMDPRVKPVFRPLTDEDEAQKIAAQKIATEIVTSLLERKIITEPEARRAVAGDPGGLLSFLN